MSGKIIIILIEMGRLYVQKYILPD